MTTDRFPLCAPFTFKSEGDYSNDQTDSGNWKNGLLVGSKYGITWQDVCAAYGYRYRITAEFMRNITPEFAYSVMRVQYWNVVNARSLWPGLDLFAFDFGFNSGNMISIEEIQKLLGFVGDDIDGDNGPKTIYAASQITDRAAFLGRLHDIEIEHYKKFELWTKYGKGWTARTNNRLHLATRMLEDPTISG